MRWVVCALALLCASPAWAEPRRIVSLDYCADQFVLALADRDQIAALSRGSQRDDSYFRARAHGIRQTRGTLEEVLALRPVSKKPNAINAGGVVIMLSSGSTVQLASVRMLRPPAWVMTSSINTPEPGTPP